MAWKFSHPEDVAPEHLEDSPTEETLIVETVFTGCAWCQTGDCNGLCPACERGLFTRLEEKREGR